MVVDEHLKAIHAERHKVQEKDTQITLLCGDLTDSQQTVVELQAEVKRLTQQTVPHLEDPSKNNGMVIIQKNDSDPYPYLAVCGQARLCGAENSKQNGRLSFQGRG